LPSLIIDDKIQTTTTTTTTKIGGKTKKRLGRGKL
jgi:hypothetical protein